MQLYAIYVALLCIELDEAVKDDKKITIPDWTNLNTKSKQLNGLYTVKDSTIFQLKD